VHLAYIIGNLSVATLLPGRRYVHCCAPDRSAQTAWERCQKLSLTGAVVQARRWAWSLLLIQIKGNFAVFGSGRRTKLYWPLMCRKEGESQMPPG
jgi:hypothetical protein